MARKFDLAKLKRKANQELQQAKNVVSRIENDVANYLFGRWVCKMVAVDVHGTWERYVENRLAAALNHSPEHFIKTHDIKGVKNLSAGLAYYVVRGGGRFFDFRSVSDLLSKGDEWLGKSSNPFRKLSSTDVKYRHIDALAALRNDVAHGSDAARKAYRRHLNSLYSIQSVPSPGEFALSIDHRPTSLARNRPRIYGFIAAVEGAIANT